MGPMNDTTRPPETEPGQADADPIVSNEPIDAEFKPAEADPVTTVKRGGPGWISTLILAALATLGGAIGTRFLPAAEAPLPQPERAVADNLDAGFEAVEAQMSALEAQLEARALAADLTDLESRLAAMEDGGQPSAADVFVLKQAIADVETRLEAIDQIDLLDRRLDALETTPQPAPDAAADGEASASEAPAPDRLLSAFDERLEAVETTIAGLERQIGTLDDLIGEADPAVLSSDLEALKARLATLDETMAAAAEAGSTADAEAATVARETAAAALALNGLITASASGDAFAAPLAALEELLPGDPDIASLAPIAETGAPSRSGLIDGLDRLFDTAEAAAPRAEGGLGLAQRLLGDQFTVSREGEEPVAVQLDALRTSVDAGDWDGAITRFDALPGEVSDVLAPWRAELDRRRTLDRALDGLQQTLVQMDTP